MMDAQLIKLRAAVRVAEEFRRSEPENQKLNAILKADEQLVAAGLPTYSDMLKQMMCEEAMDMPLDDAHRLLSGYGWDWEKRFELSAREFVAQRRRDLMHNLLTIIGLL